MSDAQVFFAVWFGAVLTLAFCAALHPLLHVLGRLAAEWLAGRARPSNITRLPALTNGRRPAGRRR